MDLDNSSYWNSFLEKVKSQIPTIDSDSLSSENEDLIPIFERPDGLSLKYPKDFDRLSMDGDELEELQNRSGDTCSQSTGISLYDDETVESTQHLPLNVEAGAGDNGVELSEAKPEESLKLCVDNTKYEEVFPVLSFARLDQFHLDEVLQRMKVKKISLQQHASVKPVQADVDGDKASSKEDEIMERLVAFCKSQTSKSVSEPPKSPNNIRWSNLWNQSSDRMAAELHHSQQERPTVYIDLRCSDPSIKPPNTSPNLSSEFSSPAKQKAHQDTPPAKKPNLKVHTGSWTGVREVTGKSVLLQKIREMKRNGNKSTSEYSDPPYLAKENKAEDLKETQPQLVETTCSYDSQHLCEDKQLTHAQFEGKNPETASPATTTGNQNRIKESKQSERQRQAKRILQPEKHQQILAQLEIHRPTQSVNQRQPAAEGTHVLYDCESSHLPLISPLQTDIESKGCLLLMVDLCSPGMVGVRANGRRKHLYPAATQPHIYNTLVAWFLSLVGPDSCRDGDRVGAHVPFWVAGLQQLWTEDGLALYVLAVAHDSYPQRKRDKDVHTPFYNHVYRFLNETPLPLVAQWLPQLKVLLDQHSYASTVPLPSSCLSCFISSTSNKKVIDRTFGLSPGFYWQTVETQESVYKGIETAPELHTEVSVALGCKSFFHHPLRTHFTLQLLLNSGLDTCGLRLLYPPQRILIDSAGAVPVVQGSDEPVLALAVRGPHAHSVFKALISSLDPLFPREPDPLSHNPLHCRGRGAPLLHSPPLGSQVHRELCLWFAGRFQGGKADRAVALNDRVKGRPPSFLCATTKAELLLVVSPLVPPWCYGQVLSVCERRGFSVRGLQRLQLQGNQAAVLGLSKEQALRFCTAHAVTQDQIELHSHSLVFILRKENAMRHGVGLPAALMRGFEAQNLLGFIRSGLDGVHRAEPSFLFHTVPYSRNLFNSFVRSMWLVPDPSPVILSHLKRSSSSDMEQVVILTLCGKDLSQGLNLLHRALTDGPEGFELLGINYLPTLTRLQAQELSPYEVGERLYHDSLHTLMSSPVLVFALRRVDAFASLRKFLPHDYPGNLSILMSQTPEVAHRQSSLFFFEHQLIPDPQMELTVCLLKPRTWSHVWANLVHKLLLRRLQLVGLRVLTLDQSDPASLVPAQNDTSDFREAPVENLGCGSSLALCLQGPNAVRRLLDALSQEDSSQWDICYGSGSHYKAIQDVKRYFPDGLCCNEAVTMRQEQIVSMRSDPLASVAREQSNTVVQESLSGQNGGSLINSALWQTTCLLIPLSAPPLGQIPSPLAMLEQLLRSGCHLVAGRMSILDEEQRKRIAKTLTLPFKGDERMDRLSMTPCLILALHGGNIVTHFKTILERVYKERSELKKDEGTIIYPGSEEEAKQLINYLFDESSLTIGL